MKIFPKIRQELMEKNKTGEYLKYAIGEIVLVVIGILIALSINNWNENRKENIVEFKILQTLNNDLQTDILNIKGMIKSDSLVIESNKQLIIVLKDNQSNYNSSIDTMFGRINRYDVFFPQKDGYKFLNSKGLEILRNDNLKSEIVNLYDFQYALIAEIMDLKKQLYLNTNSIFNEYLETISSDSKVKFSDSQLKKPNDFNALKKNTRFMNHITHIYAEQIIFLNYAKAILVKMESTSSKIEQEITKG